jgi:hypothetical protein
MKIVPRCALGHGCHDNQNITQQYWIYNTCHQIKKNSFKLSMIVIISNRSERSERHAGFFLSKSNASNVKSICPIKRCLNIRSSSLQIMHWQKTHNTTLQCLKSSSDNYSINGRWFRDNCKPPPGMTNIGWLRNGEAYLKARVWEDELSGDKSPAAYPLAPSGHGHTKNSQKRALAISHNKTHSSNKALFLLLSWQFMQWQCTRSIGVHDLSAMSTASMSTGHSIHSSQWEG